MSDDEVHSEGSVNSDQSEGEDDIYSQCGGADSDDDSIISDKEFVDDPVGPSNVGSDEDDEDNEALPPPLPLPLLCESEPV